MYGIGEKVLIAWGLMKIYGWDDKDYFVRRGVIEALHTSWRTKLLKKHTDSVF